MADVLRCRRKALAVEDTNRLHGPLQSSHRVDMRLDRVSDRSGESDALG